MNLVEGVALTLQAGVATVAASVIAGFPKGRRPPRSRQVDVPAKPSVISGQCPVCGGAMTVPAPGQDAAAPRWSSPCTDCGMRFVGVVDPARSGTELVWFPVQDQMTG